MPRQSSDIRRLIQALSPYADVIIFMLTLLAANYLWKWAITGDEAGELVTLFGCDVTAPFEFLSRHIAAAVYWLVSLFRDTVFMVGEHTIRFESGAGTTVVWSCSGLKQAFIWFCLILTVRREPGSEAPAYALWLKKLWYIPLGWIVCHAFNIFRIFLIALLIENHPMWFSFLHDFLFKYLFYGIMFVLWVIFVEKIRPSASQR